MSAHLASAPEELEQIVNELAWRDCSKMVAPFDAGALLWLTQFTKTEDRHWLEKGTEPVAPSCIPS